jgi:limonene 1,2-monooxygenase
VALDRPLRFGAFFAPFHPVGQNPTLAIEYDLQRTVELDRLGYDEVWFGEHHSGGYELIGCPEVFIAAAAERTRHVKLGTGVVSLPYHHPWLVADRLNLLDHLTRGRVIFGAGPGALPSDAYVMGIEPVEQRRMMEEALEAILALWRSDEPVSRQTDWFTMREARLQMRPYSFPHPEVAVAAMVSPSGPRLAGKHGVSLLSLSMSVAEGFAAVGQAWGVVEEMAARHAAPAPDRSTWRVLGTVHLAETREKAIEDCTYGLQQFADYFGGGAGFVPLANQVGGGRPHATTSRPTRRRATSSSGRRVTPSPTSRACSSSRAGSEPSSCSATTGPIRRPRSSPTGSSLVRSSPTSRASSRRRGRRTSGPRPSGASCSGPRGTPSSTPSPVTSRRRPRTTRPALRPRRASDARRRAASRRDRRA